MAMPMACKLCGIQARRGLVNACALERGMSVCQGLCRPRYGKGKARAQREPAERLQREKQRMQDLQARLKAQASAAGSAVHAKE